MLTDKIIVITGGAGLIGREFSKAVIQSGGTAVIADVDETAGQTLRNRLREELNTHNVDFIKIDITSKESIRSTCRTLLEKYGRIDALVNNAYPRNKNYGRNFFDVEFSDFNENVGLHLGGYFLTSQQFAEFFRTQGYGNIINMGSIYGFATPKFEIYAGTDVSMPVEYAAIKSSVLMLTKYMAKYFKNMNIRVNAISPGGILNNQDEKFLEKYNAYGMSKGMLNANDLTGTLVYLLSDASRFVNGQNIVVDDGWTL